MATAFELSGRQNLPPNLSKTVGGSKKNSRVNYADLLDSDEDAMTTGKQIESFDSKFSKNSMRAFKYPNIELNRVKERPTKKATRQNKEGSSAYNGSGITAGSTVMNSTAGAHTQSRNGYTEKGF